MYKRLWCNISLNYAYIYSNRFFISHDVRGRVELRGKFPAVVEADFAAGIEFYTASSIHILKKENL